MKAKSNIPKAKRLKPGITRPPLSKSDTPQEKLAVNNSPLFHATGKFFPDEPVTAVDVTRFPTITRKELLRFDRAAYIYRKAKADFERKRAEMVYKLTMGCQPDPKSDIQVRLDIDDRLVYTIGESEEPVTYRL